MARRFGSARPQPTPHDPAAKRADAPVTGPERLHKRIAAAGVCSRRAAEVLIREGRVAVNGVLVTDMGVKVGPDDSVEVDGLLLRAPRLTYLAMNKPRGVLTTMTDPQRRPTVAGLLPDVGAVVRPVGRLDMDTEGLLLFTNDGELANRLIHPRYGVEKEYLATVRGILGDEALDRLRTGVVIEGGRTRPAGVFLRDRDDRSGVTKLRLVLHEGRKRQIRQMCEAVGHPVVELKRVRFGPIKLQRMPPGSCRRLGMDEVNELREATKSARPK
ncbi:MAG: rRNA pseudouridine synthase [Fimbriimonadaceae bacterium]|nr:rRNA pseudouridine synthase [Fimbriimonadaceae bacterium]